MSCKVKKPSLERKWYKCPFCGCKLLIYNNNSVCTNAFIKCRTCKKEVEIKI